MISEDKKQLPHILLCLSDEAYQRKLQTEDEEEDFLDESMKLYSWRRQDFCLGRAYNRRPTIVKYGNKKMRF